VPTVPFCLDFELWTLWNLSNLTSNTPESILAVIMILEHCGSILLLIGSGMINQSYGKSGGNTFLSGADIK